MFELSRRRRHALRLLNHLRFLAENYVDQALVKRALLLGLSSPQVARELGMSAAAVNRHARIPFVPYLVTVFDPEPVADFDPAFLGFVWGTEEAAEAADADCRRSDRDRLHIEGTPSRRSGSSIGV